MVGPRRLHEPDLADYLGPHVKRRCGIGPRVEGKLRPIDAFDRFWRFRHGFLAFANGRHAHTTVITRLPPSDHPFDSRAIGNSRASFCSGPLFTFGPGCLGQLLHLPIRF